MQYEPTPMGIAMLDDARRSSSPLQATLLMLAFSGSLTSLNVSGSLETGESEIFFKDLTNGDTTYGGGRYARLIKESNGLYLIDFNNAYNPYCDYNTAYICPLPPASNHLSFAIKAGELKYGMNLAK